MTQHVAVRLRTLLATTENAYPREASLEAILRSVEEDLDKEASR